MALVTLVVPVEMSRATREYGHHLAPAADGTLHWVEQAPRWWRASPLRALFDTVVGYHGEEALAIARAVVIATDRAAREHGALALFVFTNYGPPCFEPQGRSTIERAVFVGVRAIRVDTDPGWHVDGDKHPDARGHAALASAIERALVEAGVRAP